MKKYLVLTLVATILFTAFVGCGSNNTYEIPQLENSSTGTSSEETRTPNTSKVLSGDLDGYTFAESETETNFVKIEMTTGDVMIVELYPNDAPITVANFKKLVNNKFYDGITFHRIIKSFVIQGGDPNGDGVGGSDENIKGEFKLNGVENNIKHERGTISMARTGNDYDSASSQFFIVTQTSSGNSQSLDGGYAAFGKMVAGWDTLDTIADTAVNGDSPIKAPVMNTVRFVTATPKSEETVSTDTVTE